MPASPGWTVVRYLAAGAASASIVFRWRFPAAALGVVGVSVALVSALGGQYARQGTSLALIPVTLVAAGGADETVMLCAPALATVGWLAAKNVRARRAYVQDAAERAAEREREQARGGAHQRRPPCDPGDRRADPALLT
jgi:hypothetical protein